MPLSLVIAAYFNVRLIPLNKGALYLDLFEQPVKKVFRILLRFYFPEPAFLLNDQPHLDQPFQLFFQMDLFKPLVQRFRFQVAGVDQVSF